MKKITISTLLFAAAFSIYAQDQKYVVFQDNFDWLLPWANALNANGKACGDAVGTNNTNADETVIRYINNITIDVDGTNVKANDKITEMGYTLIGKTREGGNTSIPNCIALQREMDGDNAAGVYFLFGRPKSSRGFQTPELTNAGEGISGFTVSFDWTPNRQTNGTFDVTHLAVYITNGEVDGTVANGTRVDIESPEAEKDSEMKWYHAEAKFTATLLGTDKISIRPGANQWPSTNNTNDNCRYFFKNLKITSDDPKLGDTAVEEIATDYNAPVEYYNLQGIRVAEPENGLYIVRQGNKVSKKFIRK